MRRSSTSINGRGRPRVLFWCKHAPLCFRGNRYESLPIIKPRSPPWRSNSFSTTYLVMTLITSSGYWSSSSSQPCSTTPTEGYNLPHTTLPVCRDPSILGSSLAIAFIFSIHPSASCGSLRYKTLCLMTSRISLLVLRTIVPCRQIYDI